MKPMAELLDSDHRGRDRVLLRPQGLSGTAGRGPACPVVWELGGATLLATRLAAVSKDLSSDAFWLLSEIHHRHFHKTGGLPTPSSRSSGLGLGLIIAMPDSTLSRRPEGSGRRFCNYLFRETKRG